MNIKPATAILRLLHVIPIGDAFYTGREKYSIFSVQPVSAPSTL